MEFEEKITISDRLIGTEIDDETILLDMESENYFGFDTVGSHIWRLLKDGKNLKDTYDILFETYDVDPEQLKKDILEFIEKLKQNGLVKVE